jgi:hypothetical protein
MHCPQQETATHTHQCSINGIAIQIPFDAKHRRLPAKPCNVSPGEALHARVASDAADVDTGSERHVARMLREDGHALVGVGQRDLQ